MFLPYFDEERTVTLPLEALINGGSFMLMCLIVTQVFQFEPKNQLQSYQTNLGFFSTFWVLQITLPSWYYEALSISLSRDVKVQTLLVWLICVLGWWWWRRKSERNRTVLRGVRSNECWAEGQWFFFFFF